MTLRDHLERLARHAPSATLLRADESGSPEVWLSRLKADSSPLLCQPVKVTESDGIMLLYLLEQGYPSYPALFLVLHEGEAE